jgi:hypothetical protein
MRCPSPATLSVLACLVLVCTSSLTYYKSAGDQYTRSSFTLPYLGATTVITAIINLQGAGFSYNVELWQPLTYPPNSPAQATVLTGSGFYTSSPLTVPGSWRLVITPASLSDPMFFFTINIYANNQTIGNYADVGRYNRYLAIFHNAAGDHNVTLILPSSMIGMATLNLYGPFQTLSVSGGVQQTNSNSESTTTTISYTTTGRQFYYIEVVQS